MKELWVSCGSRIVGGHGGWSQDLPEDIKPEDVRVTQGFCPETGETFEYRMYLDGYLDD